MTDTAIETPVDGDSGSDGIEVISGAEYWQQFDAPKADEPPSEDVKQVEDEAPPEVDESAEGDADPEESEPSADEDEQQQQGKPARGVQKRFSELTRKIHDQDRTIQEVAAQRDQLMQMLEQVTKGKQSDQPPARRQLPEGAPNKADYLDEHGQFDADLYIADFTEWQAERLLAKRDAEMAQQREAQAVANLQKRILDAETEFRKTAPDYPEAVQVFKSHPLARTPLAQEVALEGPAMAYYLGQHPEEMDALSQMDPRSAMKHLGRISAKIEAPTPEPKPVVERVSKAPAPPTPVRRASASTDHGYLGRDDLSQVEWEKRRNAELKSLGKRY